MPPRCLLFDLDNTLVDSDAIKLEALRRCGCSALNRLSASQLRTLSPPSAIKHLNASASLNTYWGHYRDLCKSSSRLLDPSTLLVVDQLWQQGSQLGIVTSSPSHIVEPLLVTLGLYHAFAGCLVTFGSCTRRKPHPDPIKKALQICGAQARDTIYIGDSIDDLQASRAAGVRFGLAGWASPLDQEYLEEQADHVYAQITELLDGPSVA